MGARHWLFPVPGDTTGDKAGSLLKPPTGRVCCVPRAAARRLCPILLPALIPVLIL